ncbi:uncharacterized protein BJX67DRAFT_149254 [Aspergillus lucknowensis]|uniref:Cell wall protein n=1 Tax=Aspergillus lucknowensis TaxID=176173 RepID=A0ABR4LN18_9EURO
MLLSLIAVLSTAGLATAHGYISKINVAGEEYDGYIVDTYAHEPDSGLTPTRQTTFVTATSPKVSLRDSRTGDSDDDLTEITLVTLSGYSPTNTDPLEVVPVTPGVSTTSKSTSDPDLTEITPVTPGVSMSITTGSDPDHTEITPVTPDASTTVTGALDTDLTEITPVTPSTSTTATSSLDPDLTEVTPVTPGTTHTTIVSQTACTLSHTISTTTTTTTTRRETPSPIEMIINVVEYVCTVKK